MPLAYQSSTPKRIFDPLKKARNAFAIWKSHKRQFSADSARQQEAYFPIITPGREYDAAFFEENKRQLAI